LSIQVTHWMSKILDFEVKVADLFRLKTIDKILDKNLNINLRNSDIIKPYHSGNERQKKYKGYFIRYYFSK
jgi:hypothetical protein